MNHSSLDASCYDIGGEIIFKYYPSCFPIETKIKVSICQMQPAISEDCMEYGYTTTEDKLFILEVPDSLVPGNIYCIEFAVKDVNVTVNGGVFVVTEKCCEYGKCVPLSFIYE